MSWLDDRFMAKPKRGKSGLQRAECQLTTGGRESTASATENKPPFNGKGEKVR